MVEGIIAFVIANWKVLSGIVVAVGAWHKDWIFRKLNIRKGTAEARTMERGVDTVYIENSEKLVEIYGRSMDDLLKRNDETIKNIEEKHKKDLEEIKRQYEEERRKDDAKDQAREKELTNTVDRLQKQVEDLKNLVEKLTKQLKYYEEHSGIELPSNLKD